MDIHLTVMRDMQWSDSCERWFSRRYLNCCLVGYKGDQIKLYPLPSLSLN